MKPQRNHLNHQAPDFTKQDLDSKFSEVLASLLVDGYRKMMT